MSKWCDSAEHHLSKEQTRSTDEQDLLSQIRQVGISSIFSILSMFAVPTSTSQFKKERNYTIIDNDKTRGSFKGLYKTVSANTLNRF